MHVYVTTLQPYGRIRAVQAHLLLPLLTSTIITPVKWYHYLALKVKLDLLKVRVTDAHESADLRFHFRRSITFHLFLLVIPATAEQIDARRRTEESAADSGKSLFTISLQRGNKQMYYAAFTPDTCSPDTLVVSTCIPCRRLHVSCIGDKIVVNAALRRHHPLVSRYKLLVQDRLLVSGYKLLVYLV